MTGYTVLNVMRGIRDSKYKELESIENNCAERAATKAADISKHMTLVKYTVEELEAVEDNNKRVKAVGKLTKPRMAEIFVVYRNTIIVHTPK